MRISKELQYHIVQFQKSLTQEEQTRIQDKYGLKLTEYIPDFAYIEIILILKRLLSFHLIHFSERACHIIRLLKFLLLSAKNASVPLERQNMEGIWLSVILFDNSVVEKVVDSLKNLNVGKITVIDDRKIGGKIEIRLHNSLKKRA